MKYSNSKKKVGSSIFILLVLGLIGVFISRNTWLSLQEVKTRILFWNTGLNAFLDHPISGVGSTGLEDMYDRYRSPELAGSLMISEEISSDSSHNFFIDLAFSAGFTLVLCCFLLLAFPFYLQYKSFTNKSNHSQFWIGLHLANLFLLLINPPQLTLLMWSFIIVFICAGALLPTPMNIERARIQKRRLSKSRLISPKLIAKFLSLVILTCGIVPLYSDLRFRETLYTRNLDRIEASAKAFPTNPERLLFATQLMCSNEAVSRGKSLLQFGRDNFPNSQRIKERFDSFENTIKETERRRKDLLSLNSSNGGRVQELSIFKDIFRDSC